MGYLGLATQNDALNAMNSLNGKLNDVNAWRVDIANRMTRFERIANSQEVYVYNLKIARGRIADADMVDSATQLASSLVKKTSNMNMLQIAQNNLNAISRVVESIGYAENPLP